MGDGDHNVELVCAGRLCVDLYAEQAGADLPEVDSFRRYLGGSAGNICVGTSRLGIRTAMAARVGDDQNGDFLRAVMAANGIDTSMVVSDPERLTPLVMLAVRASDDFPRLFHYAASADMATSVDDIDAEMVASARAVLITGSFLANETVKATTHRLIEMADGSNTKVVLDIDYRPALWGLAPFRGGNTMLVMAEPVTAAIAEVLGACDLIVGTREEIRIAGGHDDLGEALRSIRAHSSAVIVMKVGAQGCMVLDGEIPADLDRHPVQPGFAVDVLNNVGAGDGFFSGFLSGWLRDLPLDECARRGNATGAIVVSRHGCSPAMPTAAELDAFMAMEPTPRRPADVPRLRQLHRRGTMPARHGDVLVLAIDHRWQAEEMADDAGVPHSRIAALKSHLFAGFRAVADVHPEAGLLVDDQYGASILEATTGSGRWLARAIDLPRSRPVEVCVDDVGLALRSWPTDQIAKLMVYADPDDASEVAEAQWATMRQLAVAAAAADRRYLIEFQAPGGAEPPAGYLASMLLQAYARDITPDWWKLPPVADRTEWLAAAEVIAAGDPTCEGMLVLGQTADPETIGQALAAAASVPAVRGFAIGRAIFAEPARQWLRGELADADLEGRVAARFAEIIRVWKERR